MTGICIEINEQVFAAYVGLTASGYDMADHNDDELPSLIAAIRSVQFGPDTVRFFRGARTNRYPVNPYWPRGSCLSSACFFINEHYEWDTFEAYLSFEESTGASVEYKDNGFREWIVRLPGFLLEVRKTPAYPALWKQYQLIVAARSPEYSAQIDQVEKIIARFNASVPNENHIIFVPNLLQIYSMADLVLRHGCLYVITTHPVISTMLHEYLHPAVSSCHHLFREYATEYDFAVFADEKRMRAMGYMWDDSVEAKIRTLEESVVRAISVVLSGDAESRVEFCNMNVASGFLLVPSVVDYSRREFPVLKDLCGFVERSLKYHVDTSTIKPG
jgi:hypothetical protein